MASAGDPKKALRDFSTVTGASEQIARQVLQQNGNDLDRALDFFFNNRSKFPAAKQGDTKKLSALFDKYTSEEARDEMFGDGMFRFFGDIGVDPEKAESLGFSWLVNAAQPAVITRREFVEGLAALGVDTLPAIKKEMERVSKVLNDKSQFKQFYQWLFKYCTEGKRKTMETAMAVAMWRLVLAPHWRFLDEWCEFCSQEKSPLKSVSRDLWNQLWEFVRDVKPDFSNYDQVTGAWPSQIDLFVESMKAKGAKKAEEKDD